MAHRDRHPDQDEYTTNRGAVDVLEIPDFIDFEAAVAPIVDRAVQAALPRTKVSLADTTSYSRTPPAERRRAEESGLILPTATFVGKVALAPFKLAGFGLVKNVQVLKAISSTGSKGAGLALASAALELGAVIHAVQAPHVNAKDEAHCVDAGHQMIQIGGNDKLQNAGQSIVDTPGQMYDAARNVFGQSHLIGYSRTTEEVTNEMQKNSGYPLSTYRVAQANPDLFINKDGSQRRSPAAYGAFCLNVPGPMPYGISVSDGDKTVGDYQSKYMLSGQEFHALNPGLPTAKDAKPAEGLAVKWDAKYDTSIVEQELTTDTLQQSIFGKDRQARAKRIAAKNYAAMMSGHDISKGDEVYLPIHLTSYQKAHHITTKELFNEYKRDYDQLGKHQSVEPKHKIHQLEKHANAAEAHPSPVVAAGIDEAVNNQMSPELRSSLQHDLVSKGVPAKIAKYCIKYGAKHGVSPYLLAAQGYQESHYNPRAHNASSGAMGETQFIPVTWQNDIMGNNIGLGLGFPKNASAYNLRYATEAQAAYMRWTLDWVKSHGINGGNAPLALAGYNAGIGSVQKYGGVPHYGETEHYVAAITSKMHDWGKPQFYFNSMVAATVKPSMYKDFTEAPLNPRERQAFIAGELNVPKSAIEPYTHNGIYHFVVDPAAAVNDLGLAKYGGYPATYRDAPRQAMADKWGMFNRECVSYAAWRVGKDMPAWGGRDNQPNVAGQQSGNAQFWASNARHENIPVDKTPKAGSVIAWNSGSQYPEHSSHGHAGIVESVLPDGSIVISQYNNGGTGEYSVEVLTKPYLNRFSGQINFIRFPKR